MNQKFQGKVVSVIHATTVVVAVKITKLHPKYQKRYTITKKYMAHVGPEIETTLQLDSNVTISSSKPFSKLKKWKVVEVV